MAGHRTKKRGVSQRAVFIWLLLAGIGIFFTPQRFTDNLRFAFLRVFRGPLALCENLVKLSSGRSQPTQTVDMHKYIRLRNHLANNIQWLHEERQKVETLSGIRGGSAWAGVNFVLADIITSFVYGPQGEFIINRGKNDGLSEGQLVLGEHSIVGTISGLDSHTARVRLVTNMESTIPVKIGELDVQAIMQGSGNGMAKIIMLPVKHKVKVGDIVYAQKKPGFLDVPIITGIVAQCKADDKNPLLWDLTVRPACDMETLRSVTVIVTTGSDADKELFLSQAYNVPKLEEY
jgi:rod shape-determining protein MreC